MNTLEKKIRYWKVSKYRKTYQAWADMKNRCNNPSNPRYKDYGARGIKVCLEWINFEGFIKDMGIAPIYKSLERLDNNGNYNKENCKWATSKEQFNNRRTCVYITFEGITKSVGEWITLLGINHKDVFRHRLRKGWSLVKAACTTRTDYGMKLSKARGKFKIT